MNDLSHTQLELKDLLQSRPFRDFVHSFMLELGLESSPQTGEPFTASYQMGLQAAAIQLRRRLEEVEPAIMATLISEKVAKDAE